VPLLDGPGRDCEISEATGNTGATKELWYHRGGVILWPEGEHFKVASRAGTEYTTHCFKESVQQGETAQAIALAHEILERMDLYSEVNIAQEVIQLGDVKLLHKLLEKFMDTRRDFDHAKVLSVLEQFGWSTFDSLIRQHRKFQTDGIEWIHQLLFSTERPSPEGMQHLESWASELWQPYISQHNFSQKSLTVLLQVFFMLPSTSLTDMLYDALEKQCSEAFLRQQYAPAILDCLPLLQQHGDALGYLRRFADYVGQTLAGLFALQPEKHATLAREGQLACPCKFCREVNQFLPDPTRAEIRFHKTLKRNLLHIQEQIGKARVELSIQIERVQPKFNGICQKTNAIYEKKLAVYLQAHEIIDSLTNTFDD